METETTGRLEKISSKGLLDSVFSFVEKDKSLNPETEKKESFYIRKKRGNF